MSCTKEILTRFNKKIGLNRINKLYNRIAFAKEKKLFFKYKDANTQIDAVNEHSTFIIYLYDQEKKRQENTEAKAKQIITNISLLFAIIAFSSTIILNKDNYIPTYSEIGIVSVCIALILAFISLIIAINVSNMKRYSRPRYNIVFDTSNYTSIEFNRTKVIDFTSCYFSNAQNNSKKSSKIIIANKFFIFSILFVSIFTVTNLLALYKKSHMKIESKIEEVRIVNKVSVDVAKPENQPNKRH